MLPDIRAYDNLYARFSWRVPEYYNVGVDISDKWAKSTPHQPAIIEALESGGFKTLSFAGLSSESNRLGNALKHLGITRGMRVAVHMSQRAEVAISHAAILKIGGIGLPIAAVFGPDALLYRMNDAGVSGIITDTAGVEKVLSILDQLQKPLFILCVDGAIEGAYDFWSMVENASDRLKPVETRADDPALILYTSGTTGQPKGALLPHRTILGHLPGVQLPNDFFPQKGDRFWTPADWAWAGGLLDVLLPSLHFGVPVVAARPLRFDPEAAFHLMANAEIRNTFLPPTALKLLRNVPENGRGKAAKHPLALRSIASGGESLGIETIEWGKSAFGLSINEFYGQTECNLVLGSCHSIGLGKAGFIGKSIPGHKVAIVDQNGEPVEHGTAGEIAVLQPNPVTFLGYWNRPEATEAKYKNNYLLTGDMGISDEEGYIRFIGRDDDVITSAGYRIGPGEIEDCLLSHHAVSMAAVVGKPDALRTEIVKAFLVLKNGFEATEELKEAIQIHVRKKLAAHEYPREIAFVESLPLTTTGKIMRRILRDRDE